MERQVDLYTVQGLERLISVLVPTLARFDDNFEETMANLDNFEPTSEDQKEASNHLAALEASFVEQPIRSIVSDVN
eukprot:CAMPEP_0170496972 /NCGR_PEP_ID=MMETSP0208-20121228/23306_1 /TAXON_ID=197538 /ORGANISM="Strombidium inclinatum, Strain S3" /LENGTH=75 /DNA_ID=CAMNT_0010773643 /DNA_START=244 /DNA_END=471 /DNA_ORIENTATION=+